MPHLAPSIGIVWTIMYFFINGEGSFQIDHVVARGFVISHISSPNEKWGGFLKEKYNVVHTPH